MLTIFAKLFKILNSEQSPSQIAIAISLAAIVGFSPLLSLHNLLILFVLLLFRINLTMFLISWPLFSLIGLAFSPLSQSVGLSILSEPSLTATWDVFYNTLVGRWSNFYYSGVIGGFVVGTLIGLLTFPLTKIFINKYRHNWMDKMEKLHLVKLLKASSFWQVYSR